MTCFRGAPGTLPVPLLGSRGAPETLLGHSSGAPGRSSDALGAVLRCFLDVPGPLPGTILGTTAAPGALLGALWVWSLARKALIAGIFSGLGGKRVAFTIRRGPPGSMACETIHKKQVTQTSGFS